MAKLRFIQLQAKLHACPSGFTAGNAEGREGRAISCEHQLTVLHQGTKVAITAPWSFLEHVSSVFFWTCTWLPVLEIAWLL